MSIKKNLNRVLLAGAIAALLAAVPAFAADGDKSKIKGMITAVDGNTITVKDANNATSDVHRFPGYQGQVDQGPYWRHSRHPADQRVDPGSAG